MYQLWIKRTLDIVLASLALIILFPFLILITVILTLLTKGKPFFIQKRPGYKEHLFSLIKFKTMRERKDINGNKLTDIERITPWGSFLRRTSIDELPQLINVVKGDMSLIGPRPLLEEYLPLYNSIQKRRHDVYPGITGWAQVNGRNSISWEQKLDYDIWYVDHISFAFDFKIMMKTLVSTFFQKGINYNQEITMPKFNGNN